VATKERAKPAVAAAKIIAAAPLVKPAPVPKPAPTPKPAPAPVAAAKIIAAAPVYGKPEPAPAPSPKPAPAPTLPSQARQALQPGTAQPAAPAIKLDKAKLQQYRAPEKRAEATQQVRQAIQGEAQQAVQQAVASGADPGAIEALLAQYQTLLDDCVSMLDMLLDSPEGDEEIGAMADETTGLMDAATLAKVKAATWTNFGSGYLWRPLGSRWFFASFKGSDGKRFDLPEPMLSQFPEIAAALAETAKGRPDEAGIKVERDKLAKYATLSRMADEKEQSKAAIVFFWETVAPFAGIVMPIFLPATIQTVYNGIVGGDYAAAPGKGLQLAKEGAKAAVTAALDLAKEAAKTVVKSETLLPIAILAILAGGGFLYFKFRH
jgi:hypothetical protein